MTSPVLADRELVDTAEAPSTMTGGQAMVVALRRHGVDTIFGLPGVQLDGLFSALYDSRDAIRVIHTRHEQATAYMADGYARVTGREGVCLVVPGPGLMNASAGLSTAYACNSPVLCLTGQIRSDLIGVGRGMLHEIPHQLEMARSFTKHSARASKPADIPGAVQEAFRHLRTGRPRPVSLEVPLDAFFAEGEVSIGPAAAARQRDSGDPDALEAAARLLAASASPIIYGGGGLNRSDAGAELLELANLVQAPILLTSNARGAVSDREDLVVGLVADKELRPHADVVLAVGTRFLDVTGEPRPLLPEQKLIRIDIDQEEIDRGRLPDVTITGDARAALAAIVERVAKTMSRRPSRAGEIREVKNATAARVDAVLPQAAYASELRKALPDDGIVVSEMTQLGYWSNLGFPVYQPNTFITPGYQGTLGYGFTTAMGAKVGKPGCPVVSINGDGGFGFTLNELSTMVQHNIAMVTVVFNDSAYGNVARIQRDDLGGKEIASALVNPDYLKLADAFGVAGWRAASPAEFGTALQSALAADAPALIEVPVGVMPNPWRVLGLR